MSLVTRRGWVVPEKDNCCLDIVLSEVSDVDRILPHCEQRRVAVQAGGNIGIWAKKLSESFASVHTFEPDPLNYKAMIANVSAVKNIASHNVALSDKPGAGAMFEFELNNIGANHVVDGDEFKVITIDSLNLNDVDLIQFDIEGHEPLAVLGSIETIKRSYPVVCLELKGLSGRFNFTDDETSQILFDLGYEIVTKFHRDVLFKKVKK
jgi:FkbM family methyltransferase